jgi:hypothetical protein
VKVEDVMPGSGRRGEGERRERGGREEGERRERGGREVRDERGRRVKGARGRGGEEEREGYSSTSRVSQGRAPSTLSGGEQRLRTNA